MNPPDLSSPWRWRKSSYSNGNQGDCVEVAFAGEVAAVRDSKNPDGPILRLGRKGLMGLVDAVNAGRFDA